MAFSHSTTVQNVGAESVAKEGKEFLEILTDELGLPGVNGDVKLRLLSRPWPADNLPPTTASLLGVASQKGLVAAAGPDELVITSTDKIRSHFLDTFDKSKNESPIRDFEPNTRISRSRLAHVAFTADENILLVSAQEGGGIDAYRVQDLDNAQATPALQISTEGKALRALIPNPAPDASALVAAVTTDGELLLADLREGAIRPGTKGPVLQDRVSCVSWSNKGKQIVAGLADGSAVQLKPDGSTVAVIPRATSSADGSFVTAISWLQNDTFLIIYSPQGTEGPAPPTEFFIVDREPKTANFTYNKLPEAVALFGKDRLPTHFYLNRLRDFPPHLKELIVVSATSSGDVGLISKSDKPLSHDNVSPNDYSMTAIADDSRRAALPLSVEQSDTSPIGMALDLSSKEPVMNPIPTEIDIIESPNPVPQLLVLNDEGILSSWWIVYHDSVKEKTLYPGMDESAPVAQSTASPPPTATSQSQAQANRPASTFAAPASTFGQPSFGTTPAATKPTATGFGTGTGFGSSSGNVNGGAAESSFGKPSTIGGGSSSWTSTGFGSASNSQGGASGFGQPAFGSASTIAGGSSSGFGAPSALGKPAFGHAAGAPAFGNSGFGTKAAGFGTAPTSSSPFGGASGSGTSGFASFSKAGGFGTLRAKEAEKPASPFGQASGGGFGGFGGQKDEKTSSPFAQTSSNNGSAFGKPTTFASGSSGAFGGFGGAVSQSATQSFGKAGGFTLGSSFKGDGSAKDDLPKPTNAGGGFGFGSSLDDMLGDSQKVTSPTHDKEEEMSEGIASDKSEPPAEKPSTTLPSFGQREPPKTLVTPPSSIGQPKATPAPPVSNLFGAPTTQSTTPQPPPPSSTGWSFGNVPSTTPKEPPTAPPSTTPKETPAPQSIFGQKPHSGPVPFNANKEKVDGVTAIKQEEASDDESVDLNQIPQAPLPPDTVSKPRYVSGDTSASSSNSRSTQSTDDAPLPPPWVPANKSTNEPPELPSEEEDELSGFEGSEEDGEENASSADEQQGEEQSDQLQTSPESSFKGGEHSTEASPTGGVFTKVTNVPQKPRPLFGEVGTTGPILPPPKPQQSPRSPSPVRQLLSADRLNSEAARSVSAPAHPRSVIDQRKNEYLQSGLARQSAEAQQQELARQKQQQEQLARNRQQAEKLQLQELKDDEDEQLRNELQAPIQAAETLDDFLTYQAKAPEEGAKSGVPAQIERLYRDINSMVDTLGINSRSLAAYMKYQQEQEPSSNWPDILESETPADTLNDEWFLGDIPRLREGIAVLDRCVQEAQIQDVEGKLQSCQKLLSEDVTDLRTKLGSIRKTLNARTNPDATLAAPLSAEQASVQHDLRKCSVSVQSKLVQVENALAVLRAKVAEIAPAENGRNSSLFGGSGGQKKPTVEAVTNTVLKMTKMAEQKSSDIDMLESQLRKLEVKGVLTMSSHGTPNGTPKQRQSMRPNTPGSTSSIYHTPGSKFAGSTRSTPGRLGVNGGRPVISTDDKEKWQAKARRKKEVANMLKAVLEQRKAPGNVKA